MQKVWLGQATGAALKAVSAAELMRCLQTNEEMAIEKDLKEEPSYGSSI